MKPLTFSILRLLSDNEFHSGEVIAGTAGISRASVSIALNDVNEAGLTLQKVRGRGYRLLDPVQWLERDSILKHLGGEANREVALAAARAAEQERDTGRRLQ